MAIYRCASCGSPRVMRDTETGGYSYTKGALGTVLLGAGGAAAGINGKKQTVYKCPDCGMTLSYCMPYDIAAEIDTMLLVPKHLYSKLTPDMVQRFQMLRAQYKCIEPQIESGSAFTKSLGKESDVGDAAFISTAIDIMDYLAKIGIFDEQEMVYVKNDKFPDYRTYQKFCNDVKLLFTMNGLSSNIVQKPYWRDKGIYKGKTRWHYILYQDFIGLLLSFYMIKEHYDKNGTEFSNFDDVIPFLERHPYIIDTALAVGIISDLSDLSRKYTTYCSTMDYNVQVSENAEFLYIFGYPYFVIDNSQVKRVHSDGNGHVNLISEHEEKPSGFYQSTDSEVMPMSYSCPTCGRSIEFGVTKCAYCGQDIVWQ